MVIHNNGTTRMSLGTNWFKGMGQLKDFSQQIGIVTLDTKKFGLSYENDGAPFSSIGLAKKDKDDYRTALATVRYKDLMVNLKLFIGKRNFKAERPLNEANQELEKLEKRPKGYYGPGGIGRGKIGKYGERYSYGMVVEDEPRYRYGQLSISYKGQTIGINSDWARHVFQNWFAHEYMKDNRNFEMLDPNFYLVMYGSGQVTFVNSRTSSNGFRRELENLYNKKNPHTSWD